MQHSVSAAARDLVCCLKGFEKMGEERKIIVLDDDPTGIQTVHGVYVYTDWTEESIRAGFYDDNSIFFLLTNSRAMTAEETRKVHWDIGKRISRISRETGIPFLIISRGDSTLRGHYPLETDTLREALKEEGISVDGEIICPFFPEGGRYTAGDTHYVAEGNRLVPAGETEFAKDRTFGYHSSDLKEWIEEKSGGTYQREHVISFSLAELRGRDVMSLRKKLNRVCDCQKVIVNAVEYRDLEVFARVCRSCMDKGKHYLFRTAAAMPKVLGNISDTSLLQPEKLKDPSNRRGGLLIIGSHVGKTTRQLEELRRDTRIRLVEFQVGLVKQEDEFIREQNRVFQEMRTCIETGETVAVYTSRKRLDMDTGNREDDLKISVKISEALTSMIATLDIRPSFIVAKGGITSSDVGIKGLGVKKAYVLGQVLPGIPVWKMGPESRFPGMSYIIFPGNVGSDTALYDIVECLI